ncbi:MAG: prealbumin-like fold domain-containing protein [Bacilli bacterium]|nr:prealbumin-like fold domain-containing protein [Bacilli bacterium]
MKKAKMLTLSLGFLVLGAASCAKTPSQSSSGDVTPSTSEVETSKEEVSSITSEGPNSSLLEEIGDDYAAYITYPDGTPLGKNDATVIFYKDGQSVQSIDTNEEGVAIAKGLEEGEYLIRFDEIPNGYTYNPNIYKVTKDNKIVTITISRIDSSVVTKSKEEQSGGSGNGRYDGRKGISTGVHETTISKAGENAFYKFVPSEPGIYEFSSWAQEGLTGDTADPSIGLIGTSDAFQFDPKSPISSYDNDGESKNFKFELTVTPEAFVHIDELDENGNPKLERDENGNLIPGTTWTYIVTATASRYPATFSWSVKKVGEYIPPERVELERIQCTSHKAAAESSYEEVFEFCSVDGSDEPVYNEADGFYHLNSKTGPILYMAYEKQLPGFDNNIMMASQEQGPSYFVTDSATKTYEDCFNGYYSLANSDGNTYVTEEVKTMLSAIEKARLIFTHDGLEGWLGNAAKPGYEWLFAVGYYREREGLKASNPIHLTTGYEDTIIDTIGPEKTMYFVASSQLACTWTIKCQNENFEFSYNGTTIKGGESMSLVISNSGNPGEKHPFSITNTAKKNQVLNMSVVCSTGPVNTDSNALIVGVNKIDFVVDAETGDGTSVKFTASEDGEYYLTSRMEGAYIIWNVGAIQFNWDASSKEPSDFISLKAGDTWNMIVSHHDIYTFDGTVFFEINKK